MSYTTHSDETLVSTEDTDTGEEPLWGWGGGGDGGALLLNFSQIILQFQFASILYVLLLMRLRTLKWEPSISDELNPETTN